MSKETILAADIGGTNTRFLLFEVTAGEKIVKIIRHGDLTPGSLVSQRKYHNHDFPKFIDLLKTFFHESELQRPPITACFAVAGPVANNEVKFTNRGSWVINGDEIAKEVGIKSVKLINDFVANGFGLLTLNVDAECVCLQDRPRIPTAPIACIGAGTGLGECFLTPSGNGEYQCFPSEGGHAEFAPRNDLEVRLLMFLKKKFEAKHRVSVERVVSGPGLANIYEFLCEDNPSRASEAIVAEVIASGDEKGGVISKYASQSDELCKQAMEIFITTYGSEAGVAGLKWLPFGGLYITGGVTTKNISLIKDPNGPFLKAFHDKGRVSGMLDSIPIYIVKEENLGQRGAHYVAYQEFVEVSASLKVAPASKDIGKKSEELNSTCHSYHSVAYSLAAFTSGLLVAYAFSCHKCKKH